MLKKQLPIFSIIFLSLLFGCRKDAKIIPAPEPFTKYYGGPGDETGRTVHILPDGKLMVGGYGAGPNGGNDFFLLKTDADGNEEWLKYYGGAGNEVSWYFAPSQDGGFVIGGYTSSFGAGGDDFCVIKTDADGNQEWMKTYGGAGNDNANHFRETQGGYFICGSRSYGNDENVWMIRLDENGDSLWSQTWGGNTNDGAMYSCGGPGNTHAVTGYTTGSVSGGTDGFVLVLNESGAVLNAYFFGTPEYDEPHTIHPAVDGDGWVISGHYGLTPSLTSHQVFLLNIGNDGTQRWRKTFGGVVHDGAEGVVPASEGYGIVGRSNSHMDSGEDIYFILVDKNGIVQDEKWIGTAGDDAGYGIAGDRTSWVITGSTTGGLGGKDIFLGRMLK